MLWSVNGFCQTTNAQQKEFLPYAEFNGNQAGDAKPEGWRLNYNNKVKTEFVNDDSLGGNFAVLSLSNPVSNRGITLNSSEFSFTKSGRYKASLWAKAGKNAKKLSIVRGPKFGIKTLLIRKDWKKAYKQDSVALVNGWLKYDFIFYVSSEHISQKFFFRIDIDGTGDFSIARPSMMPMQGNVKKLIAKPLLKETVRFSFEQGLAAEKAGVKIMPRRAFKTKLVDGFSGKGVTVDDGGKLSYPVKGLLSGKSGSIAVWIHQTHDAPATFTISDPIGLRIIGKNELGKTGSIFNFTTHTPGNFACVYSVYGKLGAHYSRPVKQLVKNEWRHFIFTWDSETGLKVYLDGRLFCDSTRTARKRFVTLSRLIPERIRLFTATGKNLFETATMDEICFFNRAVDRKEAENIYSQYVSAYPVLLDYASMIGSKMPFRVRLLRGEEETASKITAVVEDMSGRKIFDQIIKIPVNAKDTDNYNINFRPAKAEDYRLIFMYNNRRIRTFEITAINRKSITNAMPESASGEVSLQLLEKIDCTKDYPKSRYVDDRHVGVVRSSIGEYRKAFNEKKNSGFAYNFKIKNPGKPHWLEIEYPDDKPRAFYTVIVDELRGHGSGRNIYTQADSLKTIGVANGINNPITGKFRTKRLLFWPDSKRIMVGTFVYKPLSGQAGPALRSISLYENDGPLPRLTVNPQKGFPERSIGSWNEDPTFPARTWFKRFITNKGPSFSHWNEKLRRQIEYLRFTGQNHINLQLFTYTGDNNGVLGILPQESNSAGYLPGWGCLSALTLDRENIPFHVQINDGGASGGLTKVIGSDNSAEDFFDAASKGTEVIEMFSTGGKLAKGLLNFLHPSVQKAHLKRIRFYSDQFGRYNNFRGLLFLHSSHLTFRNEKTGYGDYTISLFEKETGIKVPINTASIERYKKRYDWLKANAWDKWLDWRCVKVKDFMLKMAAELNPGDGNERKIVFPFALETTYYFPKAGLKNYPAPVDIYKDFRAMGVDLPALMGELSIIIEPGSAPNYGLLYSAYHHFSQNIDSFWYSDSFSRIFKDSVCPSLMLSRHANMEVYGWKAPIKKYWWPMGVWGNNGRIMAFSTALPDNKYLPQSLAWNLANCDPHKIDHGWWGNPENGAVERYQKFYQAYRAIPAVRFTPVPGSNDPVVVRQYNAPDGRSGWFYLVNLQYYKVKVKVTLNSRSTKILNTVANRYKKINGNVCEWELEPYQVICYRANRPLNVVGVEAKVPAKIVTELNNKVKKLKLGAWVQLSRQADLLVNTAEKLLDEKRYSGLYYLLMSFSARQLFEAADRNVGSQKLDNMRSSDL